MGPCMCGDLCCSSCGPAQGNFKCGACGRWSSEGCDDPKKCAIIEAQIVAAEIDLEIELQKAANDYFKGYQ